MHAWLSEFAFELLAVCRGQFRETCDRAVPAPHCFHFQCRTVVAGHLLIYSVVIKIPDKKWEYDRTVHQLFIHFKKAYDLVRRDILYNILIEFGIPMKPDSVIRMCV